MIILTGNAAKRVAEIEAKEKELGIPKHPRDMSEDEQVELFLIMRGYEIDPRFAALARIVANTYAKIMKMRGGRSAFMEAFCEAVFGLTKATEAVLSNEEKIN